MRELEEDIHELISGYVLANKKNCGSGEAFVWGTQKKTGKEQSNRQKRQRKLAEKE